MDGFRLAQTNLEILYIFGPLWGLRHAIAIRARFDMHQFLTNRLALLTWKRTQSKEHSRNSAFGNN